MLQDRRNAWRTFDCHGLDNTQGQERLGSPAYGGLNDSAGRQFLQLAIRQSCNAFIKIVVAMVPKASFDVLLAQQSQPLPGRIASQIGLRGLRIGFTCSVAVGEQVPIDTQFPADLQRRVQAALRENDTGDSLQGELVTHQASDLGQQPVLRFSLDQQPEPRETGDRKS